MTKNIALDNNIGQAWKNTLDLLMERTSSHNFDSWFEKLTLEDLTEETATIGAPNEFHAEWVKGSFSELVTDALADIIARKVEVNFTFQNPKEKAIQENNIIQMPLWPNNERAAPNGFLRSALFGVQSRGPRRMYEDETLDSYKGIDLIYTGRKLNQGDLDVWMQIIHMHRRGELGKPIYFTFRGFLKALGRGGSGRDIERLKKQLDYLTKGHVKLSTEQYGYSGSLLHEWGEEKSTGEFFLTANSRLAILFSTGDFTRFNWRQRLAFSRSYTKWLHAFITSNEATVANPSSIKLERLRTMSDSSFARLSDFRGAIREAMRELEAEGVVLAWEITDRDVLRYVNCK